MSWTFTTSGAAILKAGAYANSTIIASGASLATWSDDAEAYIVMESRKDYLNDYASLNSEVQGYLSQCAAALIAYQIVDYDQQVQTLAGVQTKLDKLRDEANGMIRTLKDYKTGDVRSAV